MQPLLVTAVSVAATSLLVVLVQTYREPLFSDHPDIRAVAVFAWACSPLAFLANALVNHRPNIWLLWVLAAVYVTVSLATLGRPALVMDQLLFGEKDLRRKIDSSIRRRVAISQTVLIVGIVAIAVAWTVAS